MKILLIIGTLLSTMTIANASEAIWEIGLTPECKELLKEIRVQQDKYHVALEDSFKAEEHLEEMRESNVSEAIKLAEVELTGARSEFEKQESKSKSLREKVSTVCE